MRHLLESHEPIALDTLTPDDLDGVTSLYPFDLLQWFLVRHGPCALHGADAITLAIESHHHAQTFLVATCRVCQTHHEVSAVLTCAPDLWWLCLTVALSARHPSLASDTDMRARGLAHIADAIGRAVLCDTTETDAWSPAHRRRRAVRRSPLTRLAGPSDTSALAALSPDAVVALGSSAPLDTLMHFCLVHAPCVLTSPEALVLAPGRSPFLQGECRHCQTRTALTTSPRLTPARVGFWWTVLGVALARGYKETFVDPDTGRLTATHTQCLDAIGAAMRVAGHLADLQRRTHQAPRSHTH